jgi:hypothetical protein
MRSAKVGPAPTNDTWTSSQPSRQSFNARRPSFVQKMKSFIGQRSSFKSRFSFSPKKSPKKDDQKRPKTIKRKRSFVSKALDNIRERLKRTPSQKYADEEDDRKRNEYINMIDDTTIKCTKLINAKVIDDEIRSRIISCCQANDPNIDLNKRKKAKEKDEKAGETKITKEKQKRNENINEMKQSMKTELNNILKMLNMLVMSQSTMHKRNMIRSIDEHENFHKNIRQEEQYEVDKILARKSRRSSMAQNHRRFSTNFVDVKKRLSKTSEDEEDTLEEIKEAIEHLTDLENEGILLPLLAKRGRELLTSHDESAIITILKHANNDNKLITFLKYRRSNTENVSKNKQKRDTITESLNNELLERAIIHSSLTKGKKTAKTILDSLMNITSDTQPSMVLTKDVLLRIKNDTLNTFNEIAREAINMAESCGISKSKAAQQAALNAKMTTALNSNKAIDLNNKSIKSFVRIRPDNHSPYSNHQLTEPPGIKKLTNNTIECVTSSGSNNETIKKIVTVDHVFHENISQSEVFNAIEPMVLCTLVGFNSTIFAYGTR